MISILLPAYNSDLLLQSVFMESLKNSSGAVEVIVYDNGGNEEFIWKYNQKSYYMGTNLKVIGDGKNIGLNAALNACEKEANCKWYYLPHTDMYLMPGWDTALMKRAKFLKPDSFLFCSRSIEGKQGHTPFHIIKDYGDEPGAFAYGGGRYALLEDFRGHVDTSVVTGYRMPFFMHHTLWEKMGGVDEKYFSYATDNDLFLSAYDAGVRRFWMVNGSLVYHLQGKSNATQAVDRNSDAPYAYFREKWAAKGYNTAQHIDDLERSLIPWNCQIF